MEELDCKTKTFGCKQNKKTIFLQMTEKKGDTEKYFNSKLFNEGKVWGQSDNQFRSNNQGGGGHINIHRFYKDTMFYLSLSALLFLLCPQQCIVCITLNMICRRLPQYICQLSLDTFWYICIYTCIYIYILYIFHDIIGNNHQHKQWIYSSCSS